MAFSFSTPRKEQRWGEGGLREEELGSWARLTGKSFLWLHEAWGGRQAVVICFAAPTTAKQCNGCKRSYDGRQLTKKALSAVICILR